MIRVYLAGRSEAQPRITNLEQSEGHRSASETPRLVVATLLRGTGSTGVETHIRELSTFCESRGQVLTVVTPFSRSVALAAPVFGLRLAIARLSGEASVAWYRYWHYRFLRHALTRELAATSSSVVYASCPMSALAALEARQGPHQRVVMADHFHASQADEWVDKDQIAKGNRTYTRIRDLERRVLPALDGIVYLSGSAQRALAEWLPEIETVPSATLPNFVYSSTPDGPSMAHSADLVSVGTLERAKNHGFLLEVLAHANRLGHRYTLDIAGDGPRRSHLERLRAGLGLQDQVRFLGYRPNIRELLPRYRAYVHASVREVMGMAVIEALAAGLPVVAVPVGGFPEIVEPGVEGLFWTETDPLKSARLLIGLLEDEPARARMAAKARARFERELAPDVVGPMLLDFVVDAISPARQHAIR